MKNFLQRYRVRGKREDCNLLYFITIDQVDLTFNNDTLLGIEKLNCFSRRERTKSENTLRSCGDCIESQLAFSQPCADKEIRDENNVYILLPLGRRASQLLQRYTL